MKYTHKLPDERVNQPKENFFLYGFKLFAGLIVTVVIFYMTVTASVDLIIDHISPETEKKIMKYISVDINMSKAHSNEKLQKVVDKLTVCAHLPYHVKAYVLDDFHVNALAYPGFKMVVTKGLLHKVKSENELAFVLGHELGHFKHKDNLKALGKGLVFALAGTLISSDMYGSLFTTSLSLTDQRYSQKQEMAADLFGVDVLHCAYGTTSGATALFEKMKKEGEGWKYLLADHPDFVDRIHQMKRYIKQKDYKETGTLTPKEKMF